MPVSDNLDEQQPLWKILRYKCEWALQKRLGKIDVFHIEPEKKFAAITSRRK